MSASTRSLRTLLLPSLLVAMLVVAGCGKRGALYLPAPPSQELDTDQAAPGSDEGDPSAPDATGS